MRCLDFNSTSSIALKKYHQKTAIIDWIVSFLANDYESIPSTDNKELLAATGFDPLSVKAAIKKLDTLFLSYTQLVTAFFR